MDFREGKREREVREVDWSIGGDAVVCFSDIALKRDSRWTNPVLRPSRQYNSLGRSTLMGGRMGMATVGKMALSPDHFNLPFDYAQLRLRPLSARAARPIYLHFHLEFPSSTYAKHFRFSIPFLSHYLWYLYYSIHIKWLTLY